VRLSRIQTARGSLFGATAIACRDGNIGAEVPMMTTRSAASRLFLILLLAVAASGCDIIGGIFKAGVWVGGLVVILLVVLVVWLLGKVRK
jgi:hypothetical protein